MARAVLIDHQTLVAYSGGRQMQTLIADLDSVLTEETSVAVVPTNVSRVVATTEETLHQQLHDKLPQGSVYCFEKVDAAVYQVFSIAESVLASLRALVRWFHTGHSRVTAIRSLFRRGRRARNRD